MTQIALISAMILIRISPDIYTWGFGFNLSTPSVWHEEVGAVIQAKLLGQGGHYSPRNARYDWLTLNHFADISDGSLGVVLSNADTSFMKLGSSTLSTLDVSTPQISPLVGGQVDGSSLGIQNQGGDTHFLQRFALMTHDTFNAVEAMRFALEHQNPLVTGVVTGGSVYPETSFSLVQVSNPNILLWTLKPADDGITDGIIARVWNLSPERQNFSLEMAGGITGAQYVTHIETPTGNATVTNDALVDTSEGNQIRTYLINARDIQPSKPTKEYKLKVKKSKKNDGDGVVVSSDGLINCGVDCMYSYSQGTVITISATANEGSTFIGWSPSSLNCVDTGSCQVTLDKAKRVKAMFVGDYSLKVVNEGKPAGSGSVTSIPSGIDCATGITSGCETLYPYNEVVTLSAMADPGSTFLGWKPTSICPETGPCIVTMDRRRTIKAIFSSQ